jgi:ribosome-interacting GTPase 1
VHAHLLFINMTTHCVCLCLSMSWQVDVIEGSRVYIPAIYVVNKIDQVRGCDNV